MRYLRMLHNSLVGGALGAAYLTILILHLNPSIPLRAADLSALYLVVLASYGANLAAVFYGLIVLRQLFASYAMSPGWLSFAVLSWFSVLAAGAVSWVTWMNLRTLAPVLDPLTTRGMAIGAAALTVVAGLCLVLALARYSFGRVGRRAGGALFTAVIGLSLAVPLWARGAGMPSTLDARGLRGTIASIPPARPARVSMLLLDGASLDYISELVTEGRLPNFGKVLDGGAAMHLATLRPTQPGPVWAAAATGKLPVKNGVRSAAVYRTRAGLEPITLLPDYCFSHALVRWGFLAEETVTATALRARPLWDILGLGGVEVAVVGLALTRPAQPVRGFLVSDQFHRFASDTLPVDDMPVVFPPALLSRARVWAGAGDEFPAAPVAGGRGGMSGPGPALGRQAGSDPGRAAMARLYDRAADALAMDRVYERVAEGLGPGGTPSFRAVRLRAVDTVGHDFLRFAMPHEFGDVSDEERRQHGGVLITAYSTVDALLGRLVARLGPADLLLVVSGFGMVPLSPEKRLMERLLGNPDLTGTHEPAPDGFLLAYGNAVEPGRRSRASILDILPTVLYFFGLPVARDLDGYARTDVFRTAFTNGRPITFIPSYDR